MLNPVKSTKVYEAVMEQIKDSVKSGELKRGDKLPSERELSEKLQVSRTSVREALKSLNMLGLIESKHGEGNFIKGNIEDSLLEPLSMVFLLIGSKNEEIIQLRRIIEPQCASMAAENITDSDLEELNEILIEMEKTSDDDLSAELDKKFHYKIAQSCGNMLISTIMFSVSALIEKYIDSSHIHKYNKEKVNCQHKAIYTALKEHDEKEAFKLLSEHLDCGIN